MVDVTISGFKTRDQTEFWQTTTKVPARTYSKFWVHEHNVTILTDRGTQFRRVLAHFNHQNTMSKRENFIKPHSIDFTKQQIQCKVWQAARQESWAVAKMTARCARYMGALQNFESHWVRPRLLSQKFLMGFCNSDRSYAVSYTHLTLPTKRIV